MNQALRRFIKARPISTFTATGVSCIFSYGCFLETQASHLEAEKQQRRVGNDNAFANNRLVQPREYHKNNNTQDGKAPSFEGIDLPEIRYINGIALRRNGHGLRSIQFFGMEVKVYVAGLYSQIPLLSEEDVMACRDSPMVLDFTFLRNVSKNRVISAWHKQIHHSSSFRYEGFEKDMNTFIEMLSSSISSGGTQTVQIVGDNTIVFDQGAHKGCIQGRNFQKAFLSTFFGERAVTEELKSSLLNGDTFRKEIMFAD